MGFIDDYKKEMFINLKQLYPDKLDRYLLDIIDEKVIKNIKPIKVDFENNYTGIKTETDTLKMVDWIGENEPIVSGSGVLFTGEGENVSGDMLDWELGMRGAEKDKMFFYKNTDPVKSAKYNNSQAVWKENANGYYGILGEGGSIFNNIFIAESVTMSGQTTTMSVVLMLESFLSNLVFLSVHDMFRYITLVKGSVKSDITKLMDEREKLKITKEFVYDYLVEKLIPSEVNQDILLKLVKKYVYSLDHNTLCHLYYKNNFYAFIDLKLIHKFVVSMLNFDYMKIDDYLYEKEGVDVVALARIKKLWALLDTYVASYDFNYDKYKLVNSVLYKKNSVHTDTDSTFVYIDPFYRIFEPYAKASSHDDSKFKYSTMYLFLYFINKYVEKILYNMTKNMNVPADKRHRIKMKNEYIIDRIIMTSSKKAYASKTIIQEGVFLKEPEIDIKGLGFKRSEVRPDVREFLTAILKTDLLGKEIVNLSDVMLKISRFKKEVRTLIKNGSMSYAGNAKLKADSEYKEPYNMMVVKAAFIWNAAYPKDTINPGSGVGIYKLKGLTTRDELENSNIPEDIKIKLVEGIYNHDRMSKYGMAAIAIPNTIDETPEWLREYINVEDAITKNLATFTGVLESFGVKTLAVTAAGGKREHISNIIEF